ncbi:leucyl/phenylalanyl-tRNA--protein transferase [Aestuariibaculum sediminum]|uniref:Leucyl/phenylalanyl-tRNA--protein transferase n=1 Tax=Aestuariibaculum sediminum TaxID=2770637 RepID=A0A8J6Q7W1_9FLAO|nr:leucyl/phenylalanyl-tRNA--protein transferase [Aestuariibaculum sediminum]MBD0830967.1 leucyl/phenylalanyl-tRNA--protein transferase [Aestuariibaculum sediminum]
MHLLTQELWFPDYSEASADGLLAIGGDLTVERLLFAYQNGIFPWYSHDEPILWWSPDPRFVLFPDKLKVSKSMRQVLRRNPFKVTINQNFNEVVCSCSKIKRMGQEDTWITPEMIEAYTKLHMLGYAKSVEVWQEGALVGGLYGVDLGNGVFCGESMFSKVSNASKVGFINLIQESNYKLIDCQVHTNHLESLGAEDISRSEFLKYL